MLYEAAISVVAHNAEFKEIHQHFITRDKNPLKKMQSMIAVACKLLRVFYTTPAAVLLKSSLLLTNR